MHLPIRVDATLKTPLYRQLVDAVAEHIVDGSLVDGVQLPSVRELAMELRINPNTVARAYRELENEGFVSSHQGKGVFVSYTPALQSSFLPTRVEAALAAVVEAAQDTDTPADAVLAELQRLFLLHSRKDPS